MKYTNANSFKAKIKNIAKEKGISPQQVQQNYLIEEILRLISKSVYKDCFILKGGYLISNIIGLNKRTTIDLDMTLKGTSLSETNLLFIFTDILKNSNEGNFKFEIYSIDPIRKNDEYSGFQIKMKANFDTLRETVFIDITTGDKITPREIQYPVKSIYSDDKISVFSYNLETIMSEKLEAVISRGKGSTRPRD